MALAFLKRIPMYANVGENHSILRFIIRRGSFRGLILIILTRSKNYYDKKQVRNWEVVFEHF